MAPDCPRCGSTNPNHGVAPGPSDDMILMRCYECDMEWVE